jgi:hypothetical protein
VGCGEHAAIVRRLRYETTAVCVLCPAPVWITVVPTSLQLLQPAAPSCRVRSIDGCRAGGQSAAGEAPVYERLTNIHAYVPGYGRAIASKFPNDFRLFSKLAFT